MEFGISPLVQPPDQRRSMALVMGVCEQHYSFKIRAIPGVD
jgi:hypothetical protein